MFSGVNCNEIKAVFLSSYLVSHEPYIYVTFAILINHGLNLFNTVIQVSLIATQTIHL